MRSIGNDLRKKAVVYGSMSRCSTRVELGVVAYAFSPITWEMEVGAGGPGVQSQPLVQRLRKHLHETVLIN